MPFWIYKDIIVVLHLSSPKLTIVWTGPASLYEILSISANYVDQMPTQSQEIHSARQIREFKSRVRGEITVKNSDNLHVPKCGKFLEIELPICILVILENQSINLLIRESLRTQHGFSLTRAHESVPVSIKVSEGVMHLILQFLNALVERDELQQTESVVTIPIEKVDQHLRLVLVKSQLLLQDRVGLVRGDVAAVAPVVHPEYLPVRGQLFRLLLSLIHSQNELIEADTARVVQISSAEYLQHLLLRELVTQHSADCRELPQIYDAIFIEI